MTISYHKYDLPSNYAPAGDLAIDTEAMGLNNLRDRLCVVQLTDGGGDVHVIHFPEATYNAPNLKRILAQPNIIKIFHFARFDVAIIQHYLQIQLTNIYCTKIASRLCRTYTDAHSLRELCQEILGVKISKQQQSSDWGAANLTPEQIDYAAADVLYLHKIREHLNRMLLREKRLDLAQQCFDFLPARATLDLSGWNEIDIFAH